VIGLNVLSASPSRGRRWGAQKWLDERFHARR
jgi:hypothetical protein